MSYSRKHKIISEVKKSLSDNQIKKALNDFLNYLQIQGDEKGVADFVLLLKNRITRANIEYSIGIQSDERFNLEVNKIVVAALNVLEYFNSNDDFDKDGIKEQIDFLERQGSREHSKIELYGKSTESYREVLIHEINHIRIFGMREPLPIDDLYVKVRVLKKIPSRARISRVKIEEDLNLEYKKKSQNLSTIDGVEIVNQYDKIMLLGKPGGGKTTFSKYVTLMYLKQSKLIDKERLPLLVNLKEYSESGVKIFDFLSVKYGDIGLEDSYEFLSNGLDGGYFSFILDGLDEVQEQYQDHTIRDINRLSSTYHKCQFIITCRVAAYNHWFDSFVDVEIANFSDLQIEMFISNWFQKEADIGKECWGKLKKDSSLKELANSPLLLTLLCIAFDDSYEFPENKSDLYEEAIEALLKKWDSSRRIRRDKVYEKLTVRKKEILLSKVAYETFSAGKYFFEIKYLEGIVDRFLTNIFEQEYESDGVEALAIIQSVEEQHGIWIKRSKNNIYSFSHLTFQEFFTAKYIINNNDLKIRDNLIDKINDEAWREVIIVSSNLLDDANDFMFKMFEKTTQELTKSRDLNDLIGKIKVKSNLCSYWGSYVKIIILIKFVQSAIEVAINKDFNIILNLLKKIESDLIDMEALMGGFLPIRGLDEELKIKTLNDELSYNNNFISRDSFRLVVDIRIRLFEYMSEYIGGCEIVLTCIVGGCYIEKSLKNDIVSKMFRKLKLNMKNIFIDLFR